MTLILLQQLRQGLPLSFAGTLLLGALAGLVVPALSALALGRRWRDHGWGPAQVWLVVAALSAVILSIVLYF